MSLFSVIRYRPPTISYVLIGLPGDKIQVTDWKQSSINGTAVRAA